MPNIKSAKKRVKVNEAKRLQNKMLRSALRTTVKAADAAIEQGTPESEAAFRAAVRRIDQAVSKGILKKNTAARRKSSLALRLNKVAK